MKPLCLKLKGFGPFAAEEIIDFTRLGKHNLFLIHGPTGAGKTTLLDAICFALYGESSGEGRTRKHMRSDLAEPAMPTEVSFEFQLGNDRYLIHRNPEYEKHSARTHKLTVVKHDATLFKFNFGQTPEQFEPIASGVSQVNERLVSLLGFKVDQFRQVVVLPQGEFRKFLLAGSAQREEILALLFRTEVYRRVQDALHYREEALRKEREIQKTRLETTLGQCGAQHLQEVETQLADVLAATELLKNQLFALRSSEKEASLRWNQAVEIQKVLLEEKKAESTLHGLQKQVEFMKERRTQISRGRKAEPLRELEKNLQSLLSNEARLAKELQASFAELQTLQTHLESQKALLLFEESKEGERKNLEASLLKIEGYRETILNIESEKKAIAQLTQVITKLQVWLPREKESISQQELEKSELEKQYSSAQSLAGQLPLFQKHLSELESKGKELAEKQNRLQQFEQRQILLKSQTEKLSAHLNKLIQQRNDVKAALQKLELAWKKGQAALLAMSLVEETDCPVCGSQHHPRPAKSKEPLPTQLELDQLQGELERIEKERELNAKDFEGKKSELLHVTEEMEVFRKALPKGLALSDVLATLRADFKVAKEALTKAQQSHDQLVNQGEALQKYGQLLSHKKSEFDKQSEELRSLEMQSLSCQTRQKAFSEELPQELQSLSELEKHVEQTARALKQALEQFRSAQVQTAELQNKVGKTEARAQSLSLEKERASQDAQTFQTHFLQRIVDEGFADLKDFQSAGLEGGTLQRWVEELSVFEKALHAAEENARLLREKRSHDVIPDLEKSEQEFQDAKRALEKALHQQSTFEAQAAGLRKICNSALELEQELKSIDESYLVIGELARVATGKGNLKISFQRFVLSSLLDEVLLLASQRLHLMSKGRYLLRRSEEIAGGRAGVGLEFEVEDSYSGTARPVSTLSGGESFLASLALALGLADVVQAHTGGVHLETIFVDEGFGTLDPESLDLAFRALRDLQQGGRLVGVISHVPELRERIEARLEVFPSLRGSSARFIVP
jgi:exonuclease SbcC